MACLLQLTDLHLLADPRAELKGVRTRDTVERVLGHLRTGIEAGRWDFDRIKQSFDWSEPEVIKILTTLDKLKLIDLQPENKVKLLIAHNIHWRKNGPVKRRHAKRVFEEFLNDGFDQQDQFLDFEIVELSPASSNILKRKLQLLIKEINDLAAMDYLLKPGETSGKKNTGIMLAMRPWVFSLAIDSMSETYRKSKSYSG